MATPTGGGGGGGGRGGGLEDGEGGWFHDRVEDDAEFCGSSNPPARVNDVFPAAPATLGKVWKDRPDDSHRWSSSLGGVDLDDEIWHVRFHFDGKDNLERKIGRADITYMNLFAMIEQEGYGWGDRMYYVREEGTGIAGMAQIQSMANVEEMLSKYESTLCVSITVTQGKSELGAGTNTQLCEEQLPISEIGVPVVYSVDMAGVLFRNGQSSAKETGYVLTQESSIPVIPVDSDEDDLNETIIGLKRKKPAAPSSQMDEHSEKEEEELYNDSELESEDSDCVIAPVESVVMKKARSVGPTTRSHCGEASSSKPDYVPSSGEEGSDYVNDLVSDDDDGFEAMNFVLPPGIRSRAKKMKPRIWYDEARLHPEEQLCLKICFVDVYQFRRAVQQLHIAQLRRNQHQESRASHETVAAPHASSSPASSSNARPPKPPSSTARQASSAPVPPPRAAAPRAPPARAPAPPTRAPTPQTTSARAFVPPRSSSALRPVRNRSMPPRLASYFTASRIHEKTVEELLRDGRK